MEHTKDFPKTIVMINREHDNIGFLNSSKEFRHITKYEHLFKIVERWNGWDALTKQRDGLLVACKMVNNSIFQDTDGEWQLSRPAELLKTITEEAIAAAEKSG